MGIPIGILHFRSVNPHFNPYGTNEFWIRTVLMLLCELCPNEKTRHSALWCLYSIWQIWLNCTYLFSGAYVSGSDSDSDAAADSNDSSDDKKNVKLLPEPEAAPPVVLANPFSGGGAAGGRLLPKPSFLQESEKVAGIKFDSSVFSNPFRWVTYCTVLLGTGNRFSAGPDSVYLLSVNQGFFSFLASKAKIKKQSQVPYVRYLASPIVQRKPWENLMYFYKFY
jgi:hypothetical protein